MNAIDMRERQLNIRLSEEESDRFERVAKHYGLNIASTIRMLFRKEERALGYEPSPPAPTSVVSRLKKRARKS